jgi:teichuronic acid biosynthesis glycosyltransferase TuaG
MFINTLDDELVSIITPAYNSEKVIMDSINSVIGQSYNKWEMLIADDCSSDGTASIVSHAARDDSRVRLISCKVNGGPAKARNASLALARGRWLAFLDSDDVWLPTKLEDTLNFARLNDSALTYTGYRRISHDKFMLGSYKEALPAMTYNQLLGNTIIATSTVMVDRLKTGPFYMKDTYYDDFACWLEILNRGFIAQGLNKDLMRYRVVEGSVSRNKIRSAVQVWRAYRDIESLGLISSVKFFFSYAYNSYLKYRYF